MGNEGSLKERLYVIIFEHDTPAGRAFDVALLWAVLASVLAVVLESVASIQLKFGDTLRSAEYLFTALFTMEYVLRLYSARSRRAYALSFFGMVDLVAILPGFVALLLPGLQTLLVIRVLRLLRAFRVLKLVSFHGEADALLRALRASAPKITVFLGTVLTIVVIMGSAMHLIEGAGSGFVNIPVSMYWAIVTLTTVGYGDIHPVTPLGELLASLLMVLGYGIIAVPTGIVSAELVRSEKDPGSAGEGLARPCPQCGLSEERFDARFCRGCGSKLLPAAAQAPPANME